MLLRLARIAGAAQVAGGGLALRAQLHLERRDVLLRRLSALRRRSGLVAIEVGLQPLDAAIPFAI